MASNRLEKRDYIRTSLRAYYLQNGFNYGNYQGLGYANMLFESDLPCDGAEFFGGI